MPSNRLGRLQNEVSTPVADPLRVQKFDKSVMWLSLLNTTPPNHINRHAYVGLSCPRR
jgi:hypothetical protein